MEITLEQVEKVRSCTGASYDEAKSALEETGGNVLNAVILLEQRGRSGPVGGDYSTRASGPQEPEAARGWQWPTGREVWKAVRGVCANCLAISLEIWKTERLTCMIPLIAALILLVLQPYVTCGLALIGLCFGYRIHISGKGTEEWGDRLNAVVDQIGDTVHDAMVSIRGEKHRNGKK